MSLAPTLLDDVEWTDLTSRARENFAAASRGLWTHHAPVDPGVTLVDLYAWLFDQRIYWIDQVSDSMQRALLRLLGGDARVAEAARTVLALTPLEPNPAPRWIAKATPVRHGRGEQALTFTVEQDTFWPAIEKVNLVVSGESRSADLERGRTVRLLAFPRGASTEANPRTCPPCPPIDSGADATGQFELHIHAPDFTVGAPFALLFELHTHPDMAPSWAPEPPEIGPLVELSWQYRNHAGEIRTLSASEVEDGTLGLRRSGLLRITPPADWVRDVNQESAYVLMAQARGVLPDSPPRLRRLVPNVVVARHVQDVALVPRELEWLPLPAQSLVLDVPEVPFENSFELELLRNGVWEKWSRTEDLLFHGPGDLVFELDRSTRTVRFGDGVNGAIPRPDRSSINFRGRGQVGGGLRGNLASGNVWVSEDHPDLLIQNAVNAAYGRDSESLDQALRAARSVLRRRKRAITSGDYEELAVAVEGPLVARAHAAVGFHAEHRCTRVPDVVTVFVVPSAPRDGTAWEDAANGSADSAVHPAPQIDAAALAYLRRQLEARRLLGMRVFVAPCVYRRVHLLVRLLGLRSQSVEQSVTSALRAYLDPLIGGLAGVGWPFGEPLRPSELAQAVESRVAGTRVVDISVGLDGNPATEACAETHIEAHELLVLDEVRYSFERESDGRAR